MPPRQDDTSRPGTKYNSELSDAAAALGIDPSKLGSLGGGLGGVYIPEEPGSRAPLREPRPGEREGHLTWSSVPVKIPEDEAALIPYKWSEPQRQRFWDRMVAAGQVSPNEPYDFDKVLLTWQKFVKRSMEATAATGKDTSPYDVIGLYAGGGAAAKSRARTVTSRNTHLTTGEAARSVLHRLMQNWLGRDASEEEVDNFHAALNSAEKRDPAITTTRYDAEGTPTSQITSGGLDAGAYAEQYAKGGQWSREHAYVQAAGPMFNALLQAIRAPV